MIHTNLIRLFTLSFAATALLGCQTPPAVNSDAVVIPTSGPAAAMFITPGEARLVRLHPDVWVHVSTHTLDSGLVYSSNGLVVRGDDGLTIVDTPWGEPASRDLLAQLDTVFDQPVQRVIATHFHDDCLAGTPAFEQRGIPVCATPLTQRLAMLEDNAVPSQPLEGLDAVGDTLTLGPVEVFYPGPGHAPDNLVVYVPHARVLFGGCAVFEAKRTTPGYLGAADLDEWPHALARIQSRYPADTRVVPGHGSPGPIDLLQHTAAVLHGHSDGD